PTSSRKRKHHHSHDWHLWSLCWSHCSAKKIDRQQFEETVRTLNNLYAEAEKLGGQSYLEGCLACLTAYTIFLCMETHYEKVLKKVSKYIQEQNEKIYAPQGLLLTDPIERGLRVFRLKLPFMKTEA
uniref:Golgin subfamily A member 7 n=1 Tax=Sciurus vulgaris TaxID=55149 RepID=A0A8D2DP68_SCIVU